LFDRLSKNCRSGSGCLESEKIIEIHIEIRK
jgi:hypothetical protein